MKRAMTDDDVMRRAEALARQCATAGVLENQLGNVLAHLKRHRSPAATRRLLDALKTSPFAMRTKSTRKQFEALARHVSPALSGTRGWEEAAKIVGWAKRLSPLYRRRSY